MQRKVNRLMVYMMKGQLSEQEFINLLKADMYRTRKDDLSKMANK